MDVSSSGGAVRGLTQPGTGQHIIDLAEGSVQIEPLEGGKRRVVLKPKARSWVSPVASSCVTSYPDELIEAIARTKVFADICDEILREESDWYVALNLKYLVLSYAAPEWFEGKTVLDFGCGMGASTMILGRMFPRAEIQGTELEPRLLAIARLRQRHYSMSNVRLFQSPSGDRLPDELAQVDAIVLSAVFEHLLPDERRTLMALLWGRLRPGGILFLGETPYRFWPFEGHTTRLPLINYLPDGLTLWATRRFSRRYPPDVTWEHLLREGIRGGTVPEIQALLPGSRLLEPSHLVKDRIDLWYALSSTVRPSPLKRLMRSGLRAIRTVTGLIVTPGLDLAFEKQS